MMNLENMVRGLSSEIVANNLINFWEHDEGSLEVRRASSNFVYAFECNKVQNFLRFSFDQDNSVEKIIAELEFMQYLQRNKFPCVTAIRSKLVNLLKQSRL
jgi:Ser/Thr protein kinase RdoA (MazF antagonist)